MSVSILDRDISSGSVIKFDVGCKVQVLRDGQADRWEKLDPTVTPGDGAGALVGDTYTFSGATTVNHVVEWLYTVPEGSDVILDGLSIAESIASFNADMPVVVQIDGITVWTGTLATADSHIFDSIRNEVSGAPSGSVIKIRLEHDDTIAIADTLVFAFYGLVHRRDDGYAHIESEHIDVRVYPGEEFYIKESASLTAVGAIRLRVIK